MKSIKISSIRFLTIFVIGFCTLNSYAQSVDKKFEKAVELYKQNKYVDAQNALTEIIDANPRYEKAFYQRAQVFIYFKDYTKAENDLVKVIEINKTFVTEAQADLGSIYLTQKKYQETADLYSKVIVKSPDLIEAYYRRGVSYYELEDYAKACADFDMVYRKNQNDIGTKYYVALCKLEFKEYENAIKLLNEVIVAQPKNADAYFYRAYANFQEGSSKEYKHHKAHFIKSLDDYDVALKLDPKLEEAYFDRGEVKMALHDYVGAIADFKKAINLFPKDLEAHYQKAMCNYHYGYSEIALKEFEDILVMDTSYVDAEYQIGVILYELQRFPEAETHFKHMTKKDDKHADTYYYLGLTYLDMGNKLDACKAFKKADALGDKESHHFAQKSCH